MKQLLLIIFLALSFVLTIFLYFKIDKGQETSPNKVSILVAKKQLSIGSELTSDAVTWKPWPDDLSLENYFVKGHAKDQDFLRRIVIDTYFLGEPITRDSLIDGSNIFSRKIKNGKRAFSFIVNKNFPILKYIRPGDYVDIIVPPAENGGEELQLLERIYVLDVNNIFINSLVETEKNKSKQTSKTETQVTVELYPEEINKIIAFAKRKSLILSLNNVNEKEPIAAPDEKINKITIIRRNKKEHIDVAH